MNNIFDKFWMDPADFIVYGTMTGRFGPEPRPRPEPRKEAPVSNEEGFSYKRLIKLLGMTTSAADGEALAAMRMANRELDRLGKTWHEFIMSKVVVVADPFDKIPTPETQQTSRPQATPAWGRGATAPARPVPPQPPQRPQRSPQRPAPTVDNYYRGYQKVDIDFDYMSDPQRAPSKPKPKTNPDPFAQTFGRPATQAQPSRISNRFAGLCVKCKERVGPGEGEAFLDGKFINGKDRWCVEHTPGTCPVKAKPASVKGTWSDLDNMIS